MNRVSPGVLRAALRVAAVSTLGVTLAAIGCGGGDTSGDQPLVQTDSGIGQEGSAGQAGDASPDKPGDTAVVDGPDSSDVSQEGADATDTGVDVSTDLPLDALDVSQDPIDPDADASGDGSDEQLPCDQIPESCNGVDDNCNGAKDEGDPGGGLPCDVPGKVGECALGTSHCSNGTIKCVQNNPATAEVCDAKDNNCDGQIDNNPTDVGAACLTTKLGVCTAGSMKCVSGGLQCVQNLQPTTEICNGLDDDCNGTVDDGFPGSGQPCTVSGQNPNTPCAQGQTNCLSGQNNCTQVVFPSSELCDGKDNDCNGTIDDPAIVNGLVCNTQLPGVCAFGKTQCAGGASTCIPDVQPGTVVEICDGKDNNCNGQTDDVANIKLECATKYGGAQNVSTWACTSGACEVSACVGLFRDCDGSPTNGCEVNASSDVNQCGQCGKVCSNAHGTPSCVAGQCQIACAVGYANCDGNVDNGCEKAVSNDVNNCGACGFVCDSSTGTPSCNNGICSITCNGGLGNCDGNVQNGCETNLSNNPAHCGSCTTVCSSNGGVPSCSNGQCAISCNGGFGNCDGNVQNGCEVNLTADPSHCGNCSTVCPSIGGTATCSNGQCGITCNTGFANCDGNLSNGCEVNTTNNPSNCGGCGAACNLPNASATCSNSTCQVQSCVGGFGNCNAFPGDGCEVNTSNNVGACGGCGISCSGNNGTPGCAGGLCNISCLGGWGNCDGNAQANGCEANLNSDGANCGWCGHSCGGQPCINGVCGCVPTGARAGFNSMTENTTTGCWNTDICGADAYSWGGQGVSFQGFGQAVACGGAPTCVAHVGITTYAGAPVCQGIWDVLCDGTKVGTINTLGGPCTGSAMSNGCSTTFPAAICSSIKLVAMPDGDATTWCCGGTDPDSMITAISAW